MGAQAMKRNGWTVYTSMSVKTVKVSFGLITRTLELSVSRSALGGYSVLAIDKDYHDLKVSPRMTKSGCFKWAARIEKIWVDTGSLKG
jgi:hypothetical protein